MEASSTRGIEQGSGKLEKPHLDSDTIEMSFDEDGRGDREETSKFGLFSSFTLAWSWLCRTYSIHIYTRTGTPGRQGCILLILLFALST